MIESVIFIFVMVLILLANLLWDLPGDHRRRREEQKFQRTLKQHWKGTRNDSRD